MKRSKLTMVFGVMLCAATPMAFAAGNAEAGKAKAAQVCAACHGPDGGKPIAADHPVLAGQYADYLARAISDYKSGARTNAIMKSFAGALTKQEIEDLAAWFASQSSGLASRR